MASSLHLPSITENLSLVHTPQLILYFLIVVYYNMFCKTFLKEGELASYSVKFPELSSSDAFKEHLKNFLTTKVSELFL